MYAGPRLFAVADGVGGSAAGEVASYLTITALAPLDTDDGITDPAAALGDAIRRANTSLGEAIARNPRLDGMGTTLTALLWAGGQAALAQVGDSRAYLWRDRQMQQISRDHTLVQSLVDEGQITEDEAAVHPRRSWILRAIDGRDEVEPDLITLDVHVGDRYLLCSDGLSDYVSADDIAQRLGEADPDAAAERLVDAALAAGAPDNVSCIVIDVEDGNASADTRPPVLGGAAAQPPALLGDPPGDTATPPAGVDDGEAERTTAEKPRGRSLGRRLAVVSGIVVVLLGAAVAGTVIYIHHQWYVSQVGGNVAIYQGVQGQALGIDLSHLHARTDLPVGRLQQDDRDRITSTIGVGGLSAAQTVVRQLRERACRLWQSSQPPAPRHRHHNHRAAKPPPPPTWCAGTTISEGQ